MMSRLGVRACQWAKFVSAGMKACQLVQAPVSNWTSICCKSAEGEKNSGNTLKLGKRAVRITRKVFQKMRELGSSSEPAAGEKKIQFVF